MIYGAVVCAQSPHLQAKVRQECDVTSKCRPAEGSGHSASNRAHLQRLRHRRTQARIAARDAGPVGRPGDCADARILRRMFENEWRAVLPGLYEAERRLAVRQRQFVRLTRSRRLSRLCRSDGRRRLCLRYEPDGDTIKSRPAGCGAQTSTLLCYFVSARRGGKTSCITTACETTHETYRKDAALLWGQRRDPSGSIAEVSPFVNSCRERGEQTR